MTNDPIIAAALAIVGSMLLTTIRTTHPHIVMGIVITLLIYICQRRLKQNGFSWKKKSRNETKNGDGSLAITFGNILTIIVMIASVAVVYGSINTRVEAVEINLQLKADRELIETHLEYITQQIEEVKNSLNELNKRRK